MKQIQPQKLVEILPARRTEQFIAVVHAIAMRASNSSSPVLWGNLDRPGIVNHDLRLRGCGFFEALTTESTYLGSQPDILGTVRAFFRCWRFGLCSI
jgi:hypothetical protein